MPEPAANEVVAIPEPLGGSGGGYVLPGKGLKDRRLERRAIMQRWNVPEQNLAPLVDRQVKLAMDANVPARESTQAFLAVLKARAQDLEIERLETGEPAQTHLHGHVMLNIVEEVVAVSVAPAGVVEEVVAANGR